MSTAIAVTLAALAAAMLGWRLWLRRIDADIERLNRRYRTGES